MKINILLQGCWSKIVAVEVEDRYEVELQSNVAF